MKKTTLGFCFLFYFISIAVNALAGNDAEKVQSDSSHPADLNSIIPRPLKIIPGQGSFQFSSNTVLVLPSGTDSIGADMYNRCLSLISPYVLPVKPSAINNFIHLTLDAIAVPDPEGYRLLVDQNRIAITAHDGAGLFYGLQSLIQLAGPPGAQTIPACSIEDHPRFSYRGVHLDVCRHFFSAGTIEKWIDLLALYKINTFHWHLTDDQGWRIEIKGYPQLQKIAAYRDQTLIGHKKELPHVFDGKPYGGYYTQEEAREIVHYAAQRHITVIPEIEMPGHAMAALAAYPNLGCTGGPYQTATYWGIFSDVYCAGNDSTFVFIQHVLDEVLSIFPSKYIHIGGDECPKVRWHDCPKCLKRMAVENLKNENELQSYFIKRIEKYLNGRGREIIGWDEILEGGLTAGATVMSWRGEEGGIAAAMQNHRVIMTPEKYVYLDYYQSLYAGEPLAGGGYLPLEKIYEYDPVPRVLNPDQAKMIIGVQANVWTEYMTTDQQAEYMMFPRIMAIAETAWSANKNRDYADFLYRLRNQKWLLKKLDVYAADGYDEITYSIGKRDDGKTLIGLRSTLPESVIRYTTDGTAPNKASAVYTDMLEIERTEKIKAAVFKNDEQQGRIFEKDVFYHKAVGKSIKIAFPPSENFNPGSASALVNGIEGTSTYNDGQWFGFSAVNLDAIIDLDSAQEIHSIALNLLKYHWQRMWEPLELTFSVSGDGITYKQVFTQKDFPVNGINSVKAEFRDLKARFIRVVAVNRGVIPPGEYIAGAKAMLMVDEIKVY